MSDLDRSTLYLMGACICCVSGLYTDMPGCIGASGHGEFLCIQEDLCCKADKISQPICCKGPDEKVFCTLGLGICGISLKRPSTCCKGSSQCFCCWGAGALPPDEDVPMALAMMFLSCYPSFGCLKKVSDI